MACCPTTWPVWSLQAVQEAHAWIAQRSAALQNCCFFEQLLLLLERISLQTSVSTVSMDLVCCLHRLFTDHSHADWRSLLNGMDYHALHDPSGLHMDEDLDSVSSSDHNVRQHGSPGFQIGAMPCPTVAAAPTSPMHGTQWDRGIQTALANGQTSTQPAMPAPHDAPAPPPERPGRLLHDSLEPGTMLWPDALSSSSTGPQVSTPGGTWTQNQTESCNQGTNDTPNSSSSSQSQSLSGSRPGSITAVRDLAANNTSKITEDPAGEMHTALPAWQASFPEATITAAEEPAAKLTEERKTAILGLSLISPPGTCKTSGTYI